LSLTEKRALLINEVVTGYRVARSTVYKLIASNQLHTIKIGKRRLVPIEAAESLLRGVASTEAR